MRLLTTVLLTAPTARWLSAVRKISAANALMKVLDVKLDKANKALMRTFQVRGGLGWNNYRARARASLDEYRI